MSDFPKPSIRNKYYRKLMPAFESGAQPIFQKLELKERFDYLKSMNLSLREEIAYWQKHQSQVELAALTFSAVAYGWMFLNFPTFAKTPDSAFLAGIVIPVVVIIMAGIRIIQTAIGISRIAGYLICCELVILRQIPGWEVAVNLHFEKRLLLTFTAGTSRIGFLLIGLIFSVCVSYALVSMRTSLLLTLGIVT